MDEKIQKLKEIIEISKNIVAFTGAGVSTDSGIPDFRGTKGLYTKPNKYNDPPEYLISHECLAFEPYKFYDYYKNNMIYSDAKPSIVHNFLFKLEKIGKLKAIVTQNIDGLHQMAGCENVLELHGSTKRNYCLRCKRIYDESIILNSNDIPKCDCGGLIRPDVVLYGEGLDGEVFDEARMAIKNCDTLLVLGTSLTVYPAASLVSEYTGDNLIIINKSTTPLDYLSSLVINDKFENILCEV